MNKTAINMSTVTIQGVMGGNPGQVNPERNVDTALDLMRRLRLAGIRSHFWI